MMNATFLKSEKQYTMPISTDDSSSTPILRLTTLKSDDNIMEAFDVSCTVSSNGGPPPNDNQENREDHPKKTVSMNTNSSGLKHLITTEMVQRPPTPPRRKRSPSQPPAKARHGEKRQKTAREANASLKLVAAIEKRLNLWTLEDYEHKPPKYWRKLSVTTLFDESGHLISCDDYY